MTDDFYSYYGVSKQDNSVSNTAKSVAKGVDVSEWQGNIDWSHVKTDGVKFAIIRAGIGHRVDDQFANNYAGCKSNSVPVGAYWYSKATTVAEAKQEAQDFLSALKGKTFEYPVYMDLEESEQFALGKAKCSELADAFLTVLEQAGYYAGLYCSTSYLNSHVSESVRKRYTIWCADYRGSCGYTGDYGIWQPGTGTIYGIDTEVDLDYAYIDYPKIIKNAGLNGFSGQNSNIENEESDKSDTSESSNTDNPDTLKQILQHVASIDKKLQ